jgi:hypothetical protein
MPGVRIDSLELPTIMKDLRRFTVHCKIPLDNIKIVGKKVYDKLVVSAGVLSLKYKTNIYAIPLKGIMCRLGK